MSKFYLIKYITLIMPFIGLAFFLYLNKSQKSKILQISVLLAVLLFSWVRFVEPNIILTKEHKISNINEKRVALIADLHLGVYKDDSFLKRVTTKINQIPNLDAVLIAGDFTFYPTKNQNLNDLFSPLSELQVPVVAVLGNHDVEKPG
jgi:predicted MPP superfamily phosphohydrolase